MCSKDLNVRWLGDRENRRCFLCVGDEASVSEQRLSRARRKRLRLKKLKENYSDVDGINDEKKRRFIGPLLPEPLPDEKKTQLQPSFEHDDYDRAGIPVLHDNERSKEDSKWKDTGPREGGRSPLEGSTPDVEPIFPSRSKRRKLAKKGKQDSFQNQRRKPIAMPFTADVRGQCLIINRVGEHAQ
eukprot:c22287_g1_i2 orf=532-1086(-)